MLLPLNGSAKPAKPNIVVFLADDMGWADAACSGNKIIKTLNIDKLASLGAIHAVLCRVRCLLAITIGRRS